MLARRYRYRRFRCYLSCRDICYLFTRLSGFIVTMPAAPARAGYRQPHMAIRARRVVAITLMLLFDTPRLRVVVDTDALRRVIITR